MVTFDCAWDPPLRTGNSSPTPQELDAHEHWSAEQALAVFEFLQAARDRLWEIYGPAVQQAWRDQLIPDDALPRFDPDEPF